MHNTTGWLSIRLVLIGRAVTSHSLHVQTISSSRPVLSSNINRSNVTLSSLPLTGTINSVNSGFCINSSWQLAQRRVVLNVPLPNFIQNRRNSSWTCNSSFESSPTAMALTNCISIASTSLRQNSWTSSVSSCWMNVQVLVVVHHVDLYIWNRITYVARRIRIRC